MFLTAGEQSFGMDVLAGEVRRHRQLVGDEKMPRPLRPAGRPVVEQ
jgi:hypothetical protein